MLGGAVAAITGGLLTKHVPVDAANEFYNANRYRLADPIKRYDASGRIVKGRSVAIDILDDDMMDGLSEVSRRLGEEMARKHNEAVWTAFMNGEGAKSMKTTIDMSGLTHVFAG